MITVYVRLQALAYTVCDYCRCTSVLCVCMPVRLDLCRLHVSTAGLCVYYLCLLRAHMSTENVPCRLTCLHQHLAQNATVTCHVQGQHKV